MIVGSSSTRIWGAVCHTCPKAGVCQLWSSVFGRLALFIRPPMPPKHFLSLLGKGDEQCLDAPSCFAYRQSFLHWGSLYTPLRISWTRTACGCPVSTFCPLFYVLDKARGRNAVVMLWLDVEVKNLTSTLGSVVVSRLSGWDPTDEDWCR